MDKVYDRLSAAARSARQVATEGQALYRTDRNNFVRDEDGTGMYERDVFAFRPPNVWPPSTPSTRTGLRPAGPDRR